MDALQPAMMTAQDKPLTEAEMDQLDEDLIRCSDGNGMGLEEVDGFFTALIVGPETVLPSEYLPEVFGGEIQACTFESISEFEEIVAFLMRHWNSIAATLHAGEPHLPVLSVGEDGKTGGNEWAHGFVNGMQMSSRAWGDLLDLDKSPGYLFPIMYFEHEHDPDPELRPPPLDAKKRDELLGYLAAMPLLIYSHYKERRQKEWAGRPAAQGRSQEKTGRNAPCPCGSGKKYKRCHGA